MRGGARRSGSPYRDLTGAAWLVSVLLTLAPGVAAAQDFRARATTSLRYVELRPLVQDTVSRERVAEGPDGRLTFEGRSVTCSAGLSCTLYRPLPGESALAGTEDVSFTAWGLGLRGLSVTGMLRARFRLSGDFVWPRSDDALDAVLGYAQLERGRLRMRLGRQQTLSGLGFSGYDGASVWWEPRGAMAVEAYAGRSLARGLSEPHEEALRGLEDFIPERDAWLLGGFAQAKLEGSTRVGLRYQRAIWSDRSGLLEERASLDAHTGLFAPLRIEGALDWDLGLNQVGRSHLKAAYPLPFKGLVLEGTLRRYVPHFELSTIWGFFSPVPYHEGLLTARLSPVPWTAVELTGGWRRYGETHAQGFLTPLQNDGWRAEAVVFATPTDRWTSQAHYQIEWGPGAFLNSADAQVRWRPEDRVELGVTATTLQQFLEFRVGEGRVWGGGLTLGLDLPRGVRLDSGAALYRHDPRGRAVDEAWNQLRAWSAVSVPLGEDAGAEVGRRWRR